MRGAPVTTIDFELASELKAVMWKPHYPASGLFRLTRDEDGLQLDFMSVIHGARSFEGVRGRASEVTVGDATILVASLEDIIRSKRAAGRPPRPGSARYSGKSP